VIRLGFLGTGWIGRNRMEAMLASGAAEAVAICEPNPEAAREALAAAPNAALMESLDELLSLGLDGLVIATPSALHADQCIAALDAGVAVFCQKPLGRNAEEVGAVLDEARRADRLLGVDLSYRHTAAMEAIRERIRAGELGKVFAADLVFHNAYGPQSGWFWDPRLSGGGCLIDLGVHLVDLALWMFDFPEILEARSTLLRDGRAVRPDEVEDYAIAELVLANGVTVRLACSWNLNAGEDAVIGAQFFGTDASAEMRNENGSFFDFSSNLLRGRERERLTSPPDPWGGRAAVDWLMRLTRGERFAGTTTGLLQTARTLDRLYASVRDEAPRQLRSTPYSACTPSSYSLAGG
jgi:predicted dehydrogenase